MPATLIYLDDVWAASGFEPPHDARESFNTADQSGLGPDLGWYLATPASLAVVSNAARHGTATSGTAYQFAKRRVGPDGHVQAAVTIGTTGGSDRGVRLTFRGRLSKFKTCYVALVDYAVSGGAWSARIGKLVNDTFTVLATATISALAAGATVRLEVVGTALTLRINGSTVAAATDSSIATGDYAGLGINAATSEAAQVVVDSWFAGGNGRGSTVPPIASLPIVWTKSPSNPLVEVADLAGVANDPDIGYATVIYAEGRLSSPIDALYMWCAPHGDQAPSEPGNVFLLTAPAPEGPWTPANSGQPVASINDVPNYGGHLSSPYVLWNPNTEQLMMWAHVARSVASGSEQPTVLFTSTDGITWALQNGGAPVLTFGTLGAYDDSHTAYLRTYWDGTQFVGYYQASNKHQTNPPEDVRIARATSPNGTAWTKTGGAPIWFPQDGGDDNHSPLPVLTDDGLSVLYASVNRPSGAVELYRRDQPTGEAGWSDPYRVGPPVGGVGAFDEAKVAANEIIYDGEKFWLYYHGRSAIGVASVVADSGGFDTVWGKGPAEPP
jgi:hypothetical protein